MSQPDPRGEGPAPDAAGSAPGGAGDGFFGLIIDRPVAVTMAVLAFMVFGAVSLGRLPLNLMPDLSYPTLTVRTAYDGAAPQEVEEQVARPLEQALSTAAGLVALQSTSRAGQADVVMEFAWGTDMDEAAQASRERAALVDLPEGARRPLLLRYDPSRDPVLKVALAGGEDLFLLRRLAETEVARRLEMLTGVAAVKVQGGLEREVAIEVDEARIHARGLTLEDVVARLTSENVNLAGGSIREGDTEYLIRTLNEFRSPEEIGWLVVANAGGARAFLRDVAEVRVTHKEREVVTRLGEGEAVEVSVYKEADANLVEVSNRVRAALFGDASASAGEGGGREEEDEEGAAAGKEGKGGGDRKSLEELSTSGRPVIESIPKGLKVEVLSDQATFVRDSLADVTQAAWMGGVLAIAVLYLFLRHGWSTFIVATIIPTSVAVGFAPMFLSGLSLNLMSLGGLGLSIGMLIDNAVVVLESIHRCREEGDGDRRAAIRGTREVAAPVTATTLTTIAVFLPITFVEGIAGRLFSDLALAVCYSQLASLGVALLLIPVLAALKPEAVRGLAPRRARAVDRLTPLPALEGVAHGLHAIRLWLAEGRGAGRPVRWVGAPAAVAWVALRGGLGVLIGGLTWAAVSAAAGAAFAARWGLRMAGRVVAPVGSRVFSGFERGYGGFVERYDRLLTGTLARPSRALVPAALLTAVAVAAIPRLGAELLPELHRGQFVVSLALPVGTPLERTLAAAERAAERLRAVDGVESVSVAAGARMDADTRGDRGQHTADLLVTVEGGGSDRQGELRARERAREALRHEPEVAVEITTPTLFSFRTPIEIAVYGEDLEAVRAETVRVAAALAEVPALRDVRSNVGKGFPEVQIRYRRDDLAARGLDAGQVAQAVRAKVQGRVATELRGGERPVDVRVALRPGDRETVSRLAEINVNPAGTPPIPLSAVADLEVGEGPSEIRRLDQRRAGVVSASTSGFDLGRATDAIEARLSGMRPAAGVRWEVLGQSREMEESRQSLMRALVLAVFLVYVIMACQFESVRQPMVILFTVPLAAIGVVAALLLTSTPLSVLVLIGLIVLAGVVVNNAIVLIDYAGLLRQRGMDPAAAIRLAGRVRLRPILVTAVTTVFGLLPMAVGFGQGAELRQPLALTVIAGIASSTLLTLVVIPAVYLLFEPATRGAGARAPAEEAA